MNQHAHGAFGACILGNKNLTPHVTSMGHTPSIDVAEDTGMLPPGAAKTYIQGLKGAAASEAGWFVNGTDADGKDYLSTRFRNLLAHKDTLPLTHAFFGFATGNFVRMSAARTTTFNYPGTLGSAIATTFNHQCDSIYYDGVALVNPFGSTAYSASEVQTLIFTNAPESQFFGLRATGTSPVFEFQLTSYANNAAILAGLKAGVEGLAAYTGEVVTFTGTLTTTGSTPTRLYSGTLTATFTSLDNVPALEARQGRKDSLVVTNGDGGNYSWNGGANFSLGASAGTVQTNQRAVSGQTGTVVQGVSAAPSVGTNWVSGLSFTATGGVGGGPTVLGDGNLVSGSVNLGGDPTLLVNIDLTAPHTIDRVRVYFDSDSGTNGLVVLVSATGAFGGEETSVTINAPGIAGWSNADFTAQSVRYIRLHSVGDEVHLFEVEAFSTTSSPGSASFTAFYPLAATPPSHAATGTGAVSATPLAAGTAGTIVPATTNDGTLSGAIYNIITTTGAGAWHDGGAQTTGGFYARFQSVLSPGSALTVLVEHSATNNGSGLSTLATFTITDSTDLTQLIQEYSAAAGATVKRYVRMKVTSITGSFAFAICYSRYSY